MSNLFIFFLFFVCIFFFFFFFELHIFLSQVLNGMYYCCYTFGKHFPKMIQSRLAISYLMMGKTIMHQVVFQFFLFLNLGVQEYFLANEMSIPNRGRFFFFFFFFFIYVSKIQNIQQVVGSIHRNKIKNFWVEFPKNESIPYVWIAFSKNDLVRLAIRYLMMGKTTMHPHHF